jgi:Fe-S cluster biogenesis protein NfuA
MLRPTGRRVWVACAAAADQTFELTEENVEKVLDEVRPYLMADGGNVEFVEIDWSLWLVS